LPTVENANESTALASPSEDVIKSLKEGLHRDSVKSIQCPHIPEAGRQRYPVWIVSFWSKIVSGCTIQQKWKQAVDHLLAEQENQASPYLQEIIIALARIP
jgi:hypothetical protein